MNDPDFDPYLPPRAPVGLPKKAYGGAEVPEGSPWLNIWIRPRGTIRGIVDSDPTQNVILLAMLGGVSNGLTRLFQSRPGDDLPVAGLLIGGLIGGSIGGILGIYLMGLLVRWTGNWLGGTADGAEVRAALAWSSVPLVALLPVQLVAMAILGQDFFRANGPENPDIQTSLVMVALGLAMMVLGLWSAFLNIKCVAEVHRFSAWRSLGALLLVGVLVFAVVFLIVALFLGLGMAMRGGG
jgi:hypothetical protein